MLWPVNQIVSITSADGRPKLVMNYRLREKKHTVGLGILGEYDRLIHQILSAAS